MHDSTFEKDLPFRRTFSFDPILDIIEDTHKDMPAEAGTLAEGVLKKVRSVPELTGPITDLSVLEKHHDLVDLILKMVFPDALWNNEIKACATPWTMHYIKKTPRFQRILDEHGSEDIMEKNMDPEKYVLAGYWSILKQHYDMDISMAGPMTLKLNQRSTGLHKYYKALGNVDMVQLRAHGEVKAIDPDTFNAIRRNPLDKALIESAIDPGQFEFYGLWLMTLVDVTREQSLSNLKQNLLKNDALNNDELIAEMESDLHCLMGSTGFKLGFSDMNESPGAGFTSRFGRSRLVEIFKDRKDLPGTIPAIAKGMQERIPVVIPCVNYAAGESEAGKLLLENNIMSLLVSPLVENGEKVGFFELTSPNPDQFSQLDLHHIAEVIPIFKTAIVRSIESIDNQIEALIKENFTSIHPSVHWRFREIAEEILHVEGYDSKGVQNISFEDVIPLYGQADIRNSSNLRNAAIQADMVKELGMIMTTLDSISQQQDLPVVREMKFRVQQQLDEIAGGLKAGDEAGVNDLLREVVQPLLRHFMNNTDIAKKPIAEYFDSLDPVLGILYDKRQAYEQSVSLINETIGDLITKENHIAQEHYPHYFEKYKTDGVEYNAYIGQSIAPNQAFHTVYLRNLRLWQLMVMCKVSRRIVEIQPQLDVKMDVAPLILVHNSPLSIKFRMDEKKFDVDGTYNIRYEIIKKRIDKATLRGTKERLTEPGILSIVFSQDREAEEYIQYIDYLRAMGLLTGEVERISLENMPGAAGLEALRIRIVTDGDSPFITDVMEMVNR